MTIQREDAEDMEYASCGWVDEEKEKLRARLRGRVGIYQKITERQKRQTGSSADTTWYGHSFLCLCVLSFFLCSFPSFFVCCSPTSMQFSAFIHLSPIPPSLPPPFPPSLPTSPSPPRTTLAVATGEGPSLSLREGCIAIAATRSERRPWQLHRFGSIQWRIRCRWGKTDRLGGGGGR